jgi:hypothetical protein
MADKETNFSKMVSVNSKRILWSLFILVIVILLVFTITVNVNPVISDRLNTVFIAAISGILALGGTLITQLWGRAKSSGEPSPPSDTPIAMLQADAIIQSGKNATLDASSSKNYDTLTIEQILSGEPGEPLVKLKEIDATKKEFTAPVTQNEISLQFKAVAKKGEKEDKKQISIKILPIL